ncbi:MAG: site-specific integrase [Acidimicrobiaceae bacterium]|nr:site-specific integrase [Acidimicrobiaceae bacterium]
MLQRQIDDGLLPKDGNITLSLLFERWSQDVMRHQVEETTLSNYMSVVRHHILPALGHKKLVELNVNDIDRLLSTKRDCGLAPSTVRRIRTILAQCLDQAIRWGLLFKNVASLSRTPKSMRTEGRTFSRDQAHQFLNATQGNRLAALYALMLCTGLRRGEALGLMWPDFDRDTGIIRVSRQLKRDSRGLVTSDTKTFRSRRAVNLPRPMILVLLEHEQRQVHERERRGARWRDSGFIFTTGNGAPVDPRNFSRDFRKVCDAAGLGHWHPHELRHSAASLMLAQWVALHIVSQVLGHSSIRMTSDVYGHLLEPDRQGAAEAMGALLWEESDDAASQDSPRSAPPQ